jgi:hypothetical protein
MNLLENAPVKVLQDGIVVSAIWTVSGNPDATIQLLLPAGEEFNVRGADLFDALTNLRIKLEARSLHLVCDGARNDVYPSRMSRDMGAGRKAYRLKFGHAAAREDIVDILSITDAHFVGTVAEQKDFYEKWIKSLNSL